MEGECKDQEMTGMVEAVEHTPNCGNEQQVAEFVRGWSIVPVPNPKSCRRRNSRETSNHAGVMLFFWSWDVSIF